MCENIKCIPCNRVDDRQAVNFIFDEGVHCIKQTAKAENKETCHESNNQEVQNKNSV